MDIFCKNVHGRVVIRYLAFIIRNLKIFCVIFLKKMVVRVAVLPRVDQLTKVMPNFWRAVYSTTVCNWSLDMTPIPLKVFWAKLKFEIRSNFEELWLKMSSVDHSKNFTHVTTMLLSWRVWLLCDRPNMFWTRALENFVEFQIRLKYWQLDGRLTCSNFFFKKNTMPSWCSL